MLALDGSLVSSLISKSNSPSPPVDKDTTAPLLLLVVVPFCSVLIASSINDVHVFTGIPCDGGFLLELFVLVCTMFELVSTMCTSLCLVGS